MLVARVQVCVIYAHAAIGKLSTEEWKDGTALHYWFMDPVFGVAEWSAPIIGPLVATGLGVAALTWGTVLLELGLAAGIVAGRWWRWGLLALGTALHTGIALLLGLVTFGITMIGALVLYLVRDGDVAVLRRELAGRADDRAPAGPMSSADGRVIS